MTIRLAMICRDSAGTIERTLDSARSLIDGLTVIDTGSTDATRKLIRAWAANHKLPLDLTRNKWVNFGHNRTKLMQRARGQADHLLLLDDDMIVHQDQPLPKKLTADCHLGVLRQGNLNWRLPFLVSGSKPWRYVGVTHEYLNTDEPVVRDDAFDAFWVEHLGAGRAGRLKEDRVLLEAELLRNPDDPRTVFYLAQTLKDLGDWRQASELYLRRARMNGWEEERFYALYQAGCLITVNRSFSEGSQLLLEAWRMRQHRSEPLRALANAASDVADKNPPPADILFVNADHYKEPAAA